MARITAWLSVLVVFLAGCENTENEPAGKSIAAAVKAYNQENGRYPARLEDLVPRHLPAVPKAGKYFYILYAVKPDGKQCWVAYQVHRDRYEEFDCNKASWMNLEVEDTEILKQSNVQRILPEMRQPSASPPAPPPKDPSPAPQDKAR